MAYLETNAQAIDFCLKNQDGKDVKLSDFKGKKVVLYFYPKDNTPGCTMEANDFKNKIEEFRAKNTEVIGVSKDSVKSHNNFACKYELPFSILSDENLEMLEAYGVWQEKSMCGKKYMGIVRTTYIIDEDGKVLHAIKVSKVPGHVEKVLQLLD